MPDYPTLADLDGATPGAAPDPSPTPASQAPRILEWLESEGFRCDLDDEGDVHLRHEGRDVYILLDREDRTYIRYLLTDLWKCGGEDEERSTALVVANSLNYDLKVVKVTLHPSGSVAATAELILEDLEAFQKATPRCLDLLGVARYEFRSRMRSSLKKAADDQAAIEALVEDAPECPDDIEGLP
jgi:hypothetical protein